MERLVIVESGDDEWIRVELRDVPIAVANGIRRMILREVPTMAVEEVLIIENSSAMPNEILAHRISLIPFISDIDNYNLPEQCSCQSKLGCEKCVVRYVLRAEAGDAPITVYSRDMTPENPETPVKPVSSNIPITMLAPGQRVELELYVRLGQGKKHTKWQAGIATLYEEDGKNLLYIESFGFLPAKRMLKEAVNILRRKVEDMISECEVLFADAKEAS